MRREGAIWPPEFDGPVLECYDQAKLSTRDMARRMGWGEPADVRGTMILKIRSTVFHVVFYTAFFLLMVVGLPTLIAPRKVSIWYVRLWARISVWLLWAICGTKVEFRNVELLPKGASIVAVKHQAFLETFALIAVLDDFTYILKKELTAIPFFGWYVRGTGMIAIDRDKKGATVALLQREVREKLKAGRQIVIFPEGTRRPLGAPPKYKSGVSALCAAAQVPCTPVALNSGLFWPRRSLVRRPGTVVIEFLPPIPAGLDKRNFMDALETAIETASDALVAEAVAGDPKLGKIYAEARSRAERCAEAVKAPAPTPSESRPYAA